MSRTHTPKTWLGLAELRERTPQVLLCQKLTLDAAGEGQQQVDSIRATLPSEKPLRGFFQPSGFLDMQPCSYIELAH